MQTEEIRGLLGDLLGLDADTLPRHAAMQAKIAEWDDWWRGKRSAFHEFREYALDGQAVRRELYRMNMAKKVCEDWASLLLNDRTVIRVEDEAGDGFVRQVFDETDFLAQANHLVEKAFAAGTGAAILRLGGLTADADGVLTAPNGGEIAFEFVDAGHIIPLSVHGGRITEAAFVSEGMERGEEVVYLETHTREADGYVIRNAVYGRENGVLTMRASTECAEVRTGSMTPLFAILTPNTQNAIAPESGLGVSIFADAVDCLKGVDLAFNNFCRDIKLGGKKVFVHQSLILRDAGGAIFTPDDVAQQLFVPLGDGDFADDPMIVEHNPELRTQENADAVQNQLNYLSFRCGLGTHHYVFGGMDGRTRLTATQYMGERQDMRQNAVKHQKHIAAFLRGAVRALLWVATAVCGIDCDPDAAVEVGFDDSFFNDSETRRSRDRAEVEAGLRTVEEYRRKWIENETE